MNIIHLSSKTEISAIKNKLKYSLIFKHSTRCPISSMALNRIERSKELKEQEVDFYLLDLIQHRDISAEIAETFGVSHESPQILLIKNGECILDASHMGIDPEEICLILNQSN
jgi:bacillithiol system protein YtxJ